VERVSVLLARCASAGAVVLEQVVDAKNSHTPLAPIWAEIDAQSNILTRLSTRAVLSEQIYNSRAIVGTMGTDDGYFTPYFCFRYISK
jgi:hypothetical protein